MKYVPALDAEAQWRTVKSANFVGTVNMKKSQRLIFGTNIYILLEKVIGNTPSSQANYR